MNPTVGITCILGAFVAMTIYLIATDDFPQMKEKCLANGGVKYESMAPSGGERVCWRADGTRIFLGDEQ